VFATSLSSADPFVAASDRHPCSLKKHPDVSLRKDEFKMSAHVRFATTAAQRGTDSWRYDARLMGCNSDAAGDSPAYDLSDRGVSGVCVGAFHDYIQRELKYMSQDMYCLSGWGMNALAQTALMALKLRGKVANAACSKAATRLLLAHKCLRMKVASFF
jgi:hypothetical protein